MLRLALLLAVGSGCATARLVGPPAFTPEDRGRPRVLVIEPFFELAELQTTTTTEYAQLMPGQAPMGYGYGGANTTPTTVAITRQVQEKPFFAKAETLARVHSLVLREVQRRRPGWRVTSTAGALLLQGDVTVVRTVLEGNEVVASNRTLKNLAFGFGLLILPLQFINVTPVEETVRVYGFAERFVLGAEGLRQRLVKYPGQPDYAVNLTGVQAHRQGFGLDVTFEEGLLADERPRPNILVEGFVDRLAAAVIALVEEAP